MEGHDLNYLLDTACWANAVTRPSALPPRVRKLIANEAHGIASISLLEVAILHRLGWLEWTATLREFYAIALSSQLAVLEITPAIAGLTNEMPDTFPGDPFDRTIAATARALDLELLTPDRAIRDAAFCRVLYYPFRLSR